MRDFPQLRDTQSERLFIVRDYPSEVLSIVRNQLHSAFFIKKIVQ